MFRCFKLFIMLLLLAGVLFFGHSLILDKASRYLYEKDDLKPADVIVVLGGEVRERVEYGVKLFDEGWARKNRLIMTGGPVVGKHTFAGMMKEQAEELGVPGKFVLLADRSRSTEQDAQYAGEILKKNGYKSIILVTSPYHSRRASIIFRKALPGIRVISAPADKSWLSFDQWWKRPRDRDTVLSEWSKFVWLWIFGVQKYGPGSATKG
jgi:uncharacterized SAM-binding protein YcdF (DUF218 family)